MTVEREQEWERLAEQLCQRQHDRLGKRGGAALIAACTLLAAKDDALKAICQTSDSGPWIEVYRAAGGGYEGLQAIAHVALESRPWMPGDARAMFTLDEMQQVRQAHRQAETEIAALRARVEQAEKALEEAAARQERRAKAARHEGDEAGATIYAYAASQLRMVEAGLLPARAAVSGESRA